MNNPISDSLFTVGHPPVSFPSIIAEQNPSNLYTLLGMAKHSLNLTLTGLSRVVVLFITIDQKNNNLLLIFFFFRVFKYFDLSILNVCMEVFVCQEG